MKYIEIKTSQESASQLCFGGEQLGGYDWGDYDITETIRTAHAAIEKGINFFDSADCYGLGQSEINLGEIIKEKRQKVLISTKFGIRINKNSKAKRVIYDNSISYIDKALDQSLKRLNTDYIDLYQVHYWDEKTPLLEIFTHLEKICQSGKIRSYGISNFSCYDLDLSQFPNLLSYSNEFSLANRSNEEKIKLHVDNNLVFIAFGVLGQGVLTGKYNGNSSFNSSDRRRHEKYVNFYGDKLEHNLLIVQKMQEIKNNHPGISIAQIALRWVIQKYPQSVIIAGIKNNKQLEENLNVFNFNLSEAEIETLDQISLNII